MTIYADIRKPHSTQQEFIDSVAKRIAARCGRRWGKTTGIAIRHVEKFLAGHRVLYGSPTADQIERYWFEVTQFLAGPIEAGFFKKNETNHTIELPGTEQRLKAKTMWNADTARGDYGDEVCLDEFQMMDEAVWTKVIMPMLIDHDGTCVFIYTPPDSEKAARSKARDPMYAAHLYKKAQEDTTGDWETFHYTSWDNPHNPRAALERMKRDMDDRSYRQEILAEDIWETPGALWTQDMIDAYRIEEDIAPKFWEIIVIPIDPSKSSKPGSDTCGIVPCGQDALGVVYALEDLTEVAPPERWGVTAVDAVQRWEPFCNEIYILVESNAGGEMIRTTINPIAKEMGVPKAMISMAPLDKNPNMIPSIQNKYVRALPVKARWGRAQCGMIGHLPKLEYDMCNWIDGAVWSPGGMDAMVIGMRRLLRLDVKEGGRAEFVSW